MHNTAIKNICIKSICFINTISILWSNNAIRTVAKRDIQAIYEGTVNLLQHKTATQWQAGVYMMNECLSNHLLSCITLTAPPPTIHSHFISSETSHHFLLTPLSAVEGVRKHTLCIFLSHLFCSHLLVRFRVGFNVGGML